MTRANPLRVLVIGSRGMLGSDLVACLERSGFEAIGLNRPALDITSQESTAIAMGAVRPHIVVNCAAYTAVDKAESEPELAFAVNRDGAGNLARACAESRIPLIHISTDYVFDGTSDRPYREDDPVHPLGVYGKSKWEGEEAIRRVLAKHLIVRTSWLYGVHGRNFVKTMIALAREREEIRVVADQYGCPTWTGNLADALARMVAHIEKDLENAPWGTYHFCGKGVTTWFELAKASIAEAGARESIKVKSILPVSTDQYPTPARRPHLSAMDCGKVAASFGIEVTDWRTGLRAMISRL